MMDVRHLILMMLACLALCWSVSQLTLMMLAVLAADAHDAGWPGLELELMLMMPAYGN